VTLVTADIDKHSDVDNADDCCMIFLNYLVNYLVWPHQQDAHQRGLGLSGLIHEEAHPTASNFS